jgi:hypothetical protein
MENCLRKVGKNQLNSPIKWVQINLQYFAYLTVFFIIVKLNTFLIIFVSFRKKNVFICALLSLNTIYTIVYLLYL